jgi:quercetin dioxygenase-like cupin family protein
MEEPMRTVLFAASALWASFACAQDFVSVASDAKVLADDRRIRVIEFQPKAGTGVAMHSHPTMVVYLLQGGFTRFTLPDGKVVESSAASGTALINPPVTHAQEHPEPSHAIVVEIAEKVSFPPAPGGPDLATVAPQHVKLLKQNDRIRVYEYTAKKGDKVRMHVHPTHVVYLIQAGKTQFTLPDGSKPAPGEVRGGQALINPPGAHAQEHLEDVRALLVEILR